MHINALVFDWDGTLAQTLEVWLNIFRQAYTKFGVHLTDHQIGAQFGDWSAYKKLGLNPEDTNTFLTEIDAIHKKLGEVSLYPGAKQVLISLKAQGYKIGLITSSDKRMLSSVYSFNEIALIFDTVITADDVNRHKPDPEALYTAMKILGSDNTNTILVGDSGKDIGAAENADMALLLFAPLSHQAFYNLHELKKHAAVSGTFADWFNFPYNLIRS